MKKRRPKNRPPKYRRPKPRPPAAPQAAAPQQDPTAARLHLLELKVAALVELAGADNVRRANARIGSTVALAALARHVANGKLVESSAVGAKTAVVELSEHDADGRLLTESVVAELGAIDPEHAKALAGAQIGVRVSLGAHQAQVLRCWDTTAPVEVAA